jgi:hypothetical protein
VDHENTEHREVLKEIIEDLAEVEGRMRAARDKIGAPIFVDNSGYESIAAHIDSALTSAGAALAEAHHKLHEP